MAKTAWFLHFFSVIGVFVTLFYLIATHQYQYHYVYAHSSNELPFHYMIACFWEGQEGSFLLWIFWHGLLGSVAYFSSRQWRNVVLGVVSSVNLILLSMILGVKLSAGGAEIVLTLLLAGMAGYVLWQNFKAGQPASPFRTAVGVFGLVVAALILPGRTGWYSLGHLSQEGGLPYGIASLLLLGLILWGLAELAWLDAKDRPALQLVSFGLLALTWVIAMSEVGAWKIGSNPFILTKEVINDPIFQTHPDFVPANGSGLNSLLQNYWMVIHPPTLFLGFSATVIPFAYATGSLIRGMRGEWVRPALPWMLFSAMLLGVGIIMGGYWAYETLNFGGYWNWDPVENSSFVPWLVAISAIHAALAWMKSGKFLGLTLWTVIGAFWLVLYSTFLTRSGILGEASVHSFTDLGLSGQLLLLLFLYIVGVSVLYAMRRRDLAPPKDNEVPILSAEFMLFAGVLVLLITGLVLTVFTSLPVFNKIFGLNLANPEDHNFYYYRWTVYLAVLIAVLSGIGQFYFWRRTVKKSVAAALGRPFFIAVLSTALVIVFLVVNQEVFAFHDRFADWEELASLSGSSLTWIMRKLQIFIFAISDEFLLFAAAFALFSNLDIIIAMVRRKQNMVRVTGGAIAHLGFALILIGIFFSAGYDQTLSKNLNPGEMVMFAPQDRVDNVMLQRNNPRNIYGYQVTYLGKLEAQAPVDDLALMERNDMLAKIRFEDASGDAFSIVMPTPAFTLPNGDIDFELMREFLNDRVEILKPPRLNDRRVYAVKFVPRRINHETREIFLEEDNAFMLYPEDENSEGMGRVSHPSRRIFPFEDVFINVYGFGNEEEESPEYDFKEFVMGVGETVQTGRALIQFKHITLDSTAGTSYSLIARGHLDVTTDGGEIVQAEPLYRVDDQNRVRLKEAYLEDIHTSIFFSGVDPNTGKVTIRTQERTNPPLDVITIKVNRKPLINLLWLGTFILTIGFIVSVVRRVKEGRKLRNKA